MRKKLICTFIICFVSTLSAQSYLKRAIKVAADQTQLMIDKVDDPKKIPNSIDKKGNLTFVGIHGWTSGFFPGVLWYLYENTKDTKWEKYAQAWNAPLEPLRHFKDHHDVGFMVGCSFGNGLRLTNNTEYRQIIIDAADALSTRFSPKVGLIKSWDRKNENQYLVIIDNMMNIELLFLASTLTGDQKYAKIARTHADNTLKNHYRSDASSYHVVDYNPKTGEVQRKHTSQGYSDSSAWSRGQSWGLYGFTMCYRETKDIRYLEHAEKIANFMLNHKNLPKDYIFYWDFDAPNIPNEPRDVSAATVAASALIELSQYSSTYGKTYLAAAKRMLKSLSKAPYLAEVGSNNNFILTSSVGSFPHNSQVTVPLSYADYYFLEAITKLQSLK